MQIWAVFYSRKLVEDRSEHTEGERLRMWNLGDGWRSFFDDERGSKRGANGGVHLITCILQVLLMWSCTKSAILCCWMKLRGT